MYLFQLSAREKALARGSRGHAGYFPIYLQSTFQNLWVHYTENPKNTMGFAIDI
jgi:hypothetical protein